MKKKNKKCKNKKFKGFTLIELLAVLVILAVLLIIAIPSVMGSLTAAKEETFKEYIDKAYAIANQEMISKEAIETCVAECVLLNLTKDMGLNNTGDFEGYVMAVSNANESFDYYITIWNSDYMVYGIKYDKETLDNLELKDFTAEDDPSLSPEYLAIKSGCDGYADNRNDTCDPVNSEDVFKSLVDRVKKRQEKVGLSCVNNNFKTFVYDIDDLLDNTIGLEGIIFAMCYNNLPTPAQETTFIFNDTYVSFNSIAPCGQQEFIGLIDDYEAWTPSGSCGGGKWALNGKYRSQEAVASDRGFRNSFYDGITGKTLREKYGYRN